MTADPKKWYFSTYVFVAAFLCIGPLALPLIWTNPLFNKTKKIVITIIIIIISFFVTLILIKSIQSIGSYYQQILQLSQYH